MNKTVTINMGGIVFHIDENAYEILKNYIATLKRHFSNAEGSEEIIADIEARIGEMFQLKITDTRQVIVMADVEEVIKTMGKPEEFADEQAGGQVYSTHGDYAAYGKKRLFRNPDDKVFGGVCSGISAYFDIDPVWLRLGFAVAFFIFGSGFLLYIVLWLALPKAKTTAEKLQMRGENVNIENIQRTIKEEMDDLKERYGKGGKNTSRGTGFITELVKGIARVVVKIIGIFAIILAIFVLCSLTFGFLGASTFNNLPPSVIFPGIFATHFQQSLAIFTLVLIIGIPFFMLLYGGARLVFSIKVKSRIFNYVMLGLWFTGLVTGVFLAYNVGINFSEHQKIKQDVSLIQPAGNTLYVDVADTIPGAISGNFSYTNGNWNISSWNGKIYLNNVEFDVVKSYTDNFELIQIQSASGYNFEDAIKNARSITYGLQQKDSVLLLHENFMLDKMDRFRSQKVRLVLKVPVGKSVMLGGSTENIIHDIKNVTDTWDPDMAGHTWEMKEEGLTCLDCNEDSHKFRVSKHRKHFGHHNEIDDEEEDE